MLKRATQSCWFLLIALAISHSFSPLAIAADKAASEHKFPFLIEVDMKAGKTGAYPNRFKHQKSGIWYVLIPGGKYRIGDDSLEDSKAIEVELSPYYISESQLSGSEFGKYVEMDFEREISELVAFVEKKSPRKHTAAELKTMRTEIAWSLIGIDLFGSSFDWNSNRFTSSKEFLAAQKKLGVAFNAEKVDTNAVIALMKEYVESFKRSIRKLSKQQDQPCNRIVYKAAVGYADWRGLSLPTEAQWEVAANLAKAKKIRIEGMFDETLEWCSDHYSYKYFSRKSDFKNPSGPRRGKLNGKQNKLINDSSIGLFSVLRTSGVQIVRGRGVSVRDFGTPGSGRIGAFDSEDRGGSIRYDMGVRLVYNPMLKKQIQQSTTKSKSN